MVTYTYTHTHTHTHTYTHDNYSNPRCAHAHRGLITIPSNKTVRRGVRRPLFAHQRHECRVVDGVGQRPYRSRAHADALRIHRRSGGCEFLLAGWIRHSPSQARWTGHQECSQACTLRLFGFCCWLLYPGCPDHPYPLEGGPHCC